MKNSIFKYNMSDLSKTNKSLEKLSQIRSNFPILNESINGKKLIYFDNAATAQKPNIVIDTISDFYRHNNSNVHRGVHSLSQKATSLFEQAREKVAEFINASPEEIIFTKGTTESINLLSNSLLNWLAPGDEILTTEMEHHSNFVPWQVMPSIKEFTFDVVRLNEEGTISVEDIKRRMNKKTKLLAITHASNTLGSINNIKEIAEIAHENDALLVVDGAQYVPHSKVDVKELDSDFYAFSGHKLFGPTGIGVLYGKKSVLDQMYPYQYGGGMIGEVKIFNTTFGVTPQRFEAGTPNIAGALGLKSAIDYVESIGFDFINKQESLLHDYTMDRLKKIPGIRIFGPENNKVSLISFLVGDIHPFDLGTILDQYGIAVRTGHHCTQPIMNYYGIQGTVRASFAFYNTIEEVDYFIESLEKAVKLLSND